VQYASVLVLTDPSITRSVNAPTVITGLLDSWPGGTVNYLTLGRSTAGIGPKPRMMTDSAPIPPGPQPS